MSEEKTQIADGVASVLNAELDALRKENETLHKMLAIAAKQREKQDDMDFEMNRLKTKWRMKYAGDVMCVFITTNSQNESYDKLAIKSFQVADALISAVNR